MPGDPTQNSHLIVLCTWPEQRAGIDMARQLVTRRLAACVNVLPRMTSVYEWKGELHEDQEHLILIKTTRGRYAALQHALREAHPYELPEIVAVPITHALDEYLNWIAMQTLPDPE